MLDKLLILRSGELIYGGARTEALPYLATYGYVPGEGENPADFYIEVAFGFVESKADPPVTAAELAGKWAAKSAEEAAAELAARPQGSCTRSEFEKWFDEAHGAVLAPRVADAVWTICAAEGDPASVEWAALFAAIDTWHVRRGERPSPVRQFSICVQRYFVMTVRGRKTRYTFIILMFGLGVLCGLLNSPDPSSSNFILFAMLFVRPRGALIIPLFCLASALL